jgi:hypothetical protein
MAQRKESPKLYFMNGEKRVHVFDIWQILLKGSFSIENEFYHPF